MKYTLLLIITFLCIQLNAQKQDVNWFFGDSLMMSFTDTGIYSYFIPSHIVHETGASISDSSGNLLFYTDGKYVWNKLHEIMPNGCCLNVDQYATYGSSVTQGAVIIPHPAEANIYYVFIIADDALSYSIVNMMSDGGYGDVEEINTIIHTGVIHEKMTAVRHGNGRDWWLFIHERIPSFDPELTNNFYRFLVSPDGISDPEEINAGELIDYHTNWGEMVFSPSGSRLALTGYNFLEIFDFDRCSGELSQFAYIDNFDPPVFSSYGCSFSPDGTKIYVSNSYGSNLYQYCLNCNDSIEDTKQLIFQNPYSGYGIAQHELGPDDKIYFVIAYEDMPNNIFTFKNMNLCVINSPNELGLLCDIDTSSVWLGNRRAIGGLPNMPNYNLGPLVGSECDTLGADTTIAVLNHPGLTGLKVYPNPATTTLTVQHDAGQHRDAVFIITNTTGQRVMVAALTTSRQLLDISALPEGIYQWSVVDAGSLVQSGRLVKLE